MRSNYFTYFSVVLIYLFTYSGLIKWATFGIDPTLILLVLSLSLMPLFLKFKINKNIVNILLVFSFLHFLLFFTSIYTISTHYYIEKIAKILLNFYIFILTLIVFNHLKAFEYLFKLNKIVLCLVICLLLYFYAVDGLAMIRYREENSTSLVPEYMSVSYYLAVSILLLFPTKKSILNAFLVLFSLFLMIVLAAKGPILFLLIAVAYILLSGVKLFTFNFFKKIIIGVFLLTLGVASIWNTSFMDNFKSRLFFLNGPELDESSLQRVLYINKSFEIINDNPFIGIGIGGFGKAFTGVDERLSSHNLILEIFTESGLIGLLVFVLLIFLIRLLIVNAKRKTNNTIYSYNVKVFIGLIILIFLSSLVASYLEDSRIPYFWIAVGISYMSLTSKKYITNKVNIE